MSYNVNVTNAVCAIGEAKTAREFAIAKDNYWKTLEQEIVNDAARVNGWIGYENPIEVLGEAMYCNKDSAKYVAELLDDYLRFLEICEKHAVTSVDREQEVIDDAKRYCGR